MKQKAGFLIISIILVFGILSGCGTNDEGSNNATPEPEVSNEATAAPKDAPKDDTPVELVMTIWGGDGDKAVYQERLDLAKQKYPNINVKLVQVAGDYDQKVQTMIVGGTAPDIMMIAENYQVYAAKDQIAPIDDMIEAADINMEERYSQDIANLMKYDGKLYGFTDRAGANILYYNKDMFDKAGVSYPTKDWNREDMLNAAQKLTIQADGKTVQYGYYPGGWWPQWMGMVYQNGGQLFDENMKPTFNTDQVKDALQFFNDLTFKHHVSPTPTEVADMGNLGADPMFAQGKIAMLTTGFWNIGSLSKIEGINWDIAPIWGPTNAFFTGLMITKDSKNKEAAFKIIDFLTTLEGQMPIVKSGMDAPATLPALSSPEFLEATWGGKKINMAAFKESRIYQGPFSPKWNEMHKVLDDKLGVFFNNKANVEDTVNQIQSGLEGLFK